MELSIETFVFLSPNTARSMLLASDSLGRQELESKRRGQSGLKSGECYWDMVGVNREGCVGTSKEKAGNLRREKVGVSVLDVEKSQQVTTSPLPGEGSL